MKLVAFFILIASLVSLEVKAFVPSEAYTFDFNVKTKRLSRFKEDKLMEAVELLREVFASEDFKTKILSHRFKGRLRYAYNKGLSNFQIYNKILKGKEELHPYMNNAMDVEIDFFLEGEGWGPISKILFSRKKKRKKNFLVFCYRETVIEERLELVSLINMGSVVMEAGRSNKIMGVVHVVDMIIESGHEEIIWEGDESGGLSVENIFEHVGLINLISNLSISVVVVCHDWVIWSLNMEV